MNHEKNDWHNKLSSNSLDGLLGISEEGPSIEEFNTDPTNKLWYDGKVCRLNAGPYNCPTKHQLLNNKTQLTDLLTLMLSDFESNNEEASLPSP